MDSTDSHEHATDLDELATRVSDLIVASGVTNTVASEVARQLARRTRAFWVAVGVGVVVAVLLGVAVVTNKSAIEADHRRWCPVVLPLVPRPGDAPPVGTPEQVERALRVRRAFTGLASEFHCRDATVLPVQGPPSGVTPSATAFPRFLPIPSRDTNRSTP